MLKSPHTNWSVLSGEESSSSSSESGEDLHKHAREAASESTQSLLQNSSTERTEIRPTAMNKLRPPSPMWFSGNLADNWKRFKQSFEIYLAASGAGQGDEKLQTQIFLHVIGDDALHIYNSFHIEPNELKLATVMEKFETYFVPVMHVNVSVSMYTGRL